ncbi:hypothetical protein V8B97DRAFT_45549 [Scleroderma yunnanense]
MASENAKLTVNNLFNVEGWVCVVTGGGTGVGLVISQAFANNGARVYITSRRENVLKNTAEHWGSCLAHPQGKLIYATCDINSKDSIRKFVDEIEKKEDHVDLVVNNAGTLGSRDAEQEHWDPVELAEQLFNDDPAQWEGVYKTNVVGTFFISAAFLPLLHAATGRRPQYTPSIINISSVAGISRTTFDHVKYNVSKAAAIHLTTMLAQKFKNEVRVNSIAPGIFPSEMTVGTSDEHNKSHLSTEYWEKWGIPAGRPGREEDIAQIALLLACNQYVYGQTIAVDGGYMIAHG